MCNKESFVKDGDRRDYLINNFGIIGKFFGKKIKFRCIFLLCSKINF